ncbi:ABC transporter ATP-binding protein [Clostridium sp. DJ247]|uniref:ABC transporter ATP-binding protein n=1 Tax=Clostridium sp. DJ247 TaxID=2726188 RepID=UPI0016255176|nr:ABC transporter ATP-binding protein [Clostridium sp. DJ247]MBC2582711.1 ABC transporter ATP-binding protein [Clostridium sp. DJ247]
MSLISEAASAINIENLNKNFRIDNGDVNVLNNVNLTVNQGEFLSIVGSSGCGKSTLLRIIAGLERNYSGQIFLGGKHIEGPGVDRGMVFQEARLFPWLTVEDNIAFGLSRNTSKKQKQELVKEHLELIGLSSFAKAYPHQLSGGMQQRISIARALVNKPKVLLLDEPFGALDAMTRINMQQEILRIWEKENTTMILVTHDIDEAIYLGDRVAVMSSRPGKVKKIVPVPLARPRDRSDYDFVKIKREIYGEFFTEVENPFAYII